MTTNQNEHRNTELCRALAAELEGAQAEIERLQKNCEIWHGRAIRASNNEVQYERELKRANALNGELLASLREIAWKRNPELAPSKLVEAIEKIALAAIAKAEAKR